MTEDTTPNPKKLIIEFLELAKKFGDEAVSGDGNPSYAAGKAIAYFRAAEKLAKIVCPEAVGSKAFSRLLEKLTPLSVKHRAARCPEASDKEEFLIDGQPIRTSPPVKASARGPGTGPGPRPAIMDSKGRQEEVEAALVRHGWKKRDAVLAAFSVYSDSKSVEEMIEEASLVDLEN
jgi:hypothetical protein